MCKRFLILLGIVALVGFATEAFAAPFPDVRGTPYETAFTELQAQGVLEGYGDGLARPNAALNRAEALKVILEARGGFDDRTAWLREHMPSVALFSDIDQSQWYAPYVEVGFEQGIVTGYADQTFRPTKVLTVEEAITLLMRSYGVRGRSDRVERSQYIENGSHAWFTPHINAAIERNLIMHSGTLRLGKPMTRGQFFDAVFRLQVVERDGLVAFNGAEPPGMQSAIPVGTAAMPVQPTTGQGNAVRHLYGSEQYFAIAMPTLGIQDLTVTHPEDPFSKDGLLSVLQYGVGHLFGYPGGGGKVMVYGHSSGYPWDVSSYTKVFRQINKLAIGDRVFVTYAGKLFVYEVSHKEAIDAGDQGPFADDGSGEELILYTCWPPDSISQRYLVHALPVGTVALE